MERTPSPVEEQANPELARYLNRSYWESVNQNDTPDVRPTSPSAPATLIVDSKSKSKENGVVDHELEAFITGLKSQVEIFINRMKSNSSRGRSIANDTGVQTVFMNITALHSKLLRYIQQHDDSRLHYERLQDKLTQVKDARAALDDLRAEHREKLRREAEEAERQRQLQMAQKLEIMRKKKQEYLQYQRQLAIQRIQEQEREMQMRQEHQKQQYLMGYMNAQPQFPQPQPPSGVVPPPQFHQYQYVPQAMPPQMIPQPHPHHQMQPPPYVPTYGHSMPPNPNQMMSLPMGISMHGPPSQNAPPPTPQFSQPQPPQPQKAEAKTAELISFDD